MHTRFSLEVSKNALISAFPMPLRMHLQKTACFQSFTKTDRVQVAPCRYIPDKRILKECQPVNYNAINTECLCMVRHTFANQI